MSSGGITSVSNQPLPSAPVTQPSNQSQLPVAAQPSGVPATGYDAGATAGGGLADDGLPQVAAGLASYAADQAGSAPAPSTDQLAAANAAAGNQVQIQAPQAPSGPPAWNDEWMTKFQEAGTPAEIVQQMMLTGANGADEAQLQQMLDQITAEVDAQLAQFAADHADEFKALHASKQIDQAMLVQIAVAVNTDQLPEEELKAMVEQAEMTPGKMIKDMLFKEMLPWMVIPGWGAIRFGASIFNGGHDPISGREIHLDFWRHGMEGWMDAAFAVGGAATLVNAARGAMQVANGHNLIKSAAAGGDIAHLAAQEGVANLQGWAKAKSFIPGTQSNQAVSAISRLDGNLVKGIKALQGEERALAELTLSKWKAGEISIQGQGSLKFGKMGVHSQSRGSLPVIGRRNKAMFEWTVKDGKTILNLDSRMTGKSLAAHLSSAGVNLTDAGTLRRMEVAIMQDAIAAGKPMAKPPLELLQQHILGRASKQLAEAGVITKGEGFSALMSKLRPGPVDDAFKAIHALNAGTIGEISGLAAMPKFAKFGLAGAAVAGAGYYFGIKKPAADAATAAAAAEQQGQSPAGQTQAGQAPGAAAQVQMTPELQAAINEFLQLPAETQAAIIQDQMTTLQEAANTPNLTPEDQQMIAQRMGELDLLVQAVQGQQQGAAVAPVPQTGATAPVAPASSNVAPVMPSADSLTPQGLGLTQ